MTNLPAALREQLSREASIALPQLCGVRSADGTVRYVLAIGSGESRTGQVREHRNRVHAGGKSPDDLHFDAGGLRGGLPISA